MATSVGSWIEEWTNALRQRNVRIVITRLALKGETDEPYNTPAQKQNKLKKREGCTYIFYTAHLTDKSFCFISADDCKYWSQMSVWLLGNAVVVVVAIGVTLAIVVILDSNLS
jgi:hypothetical protein